MLYHLIRKQIQLFKDSPRETVFFYHHLIELYDKFELEQYKEPYKEAHIKNTVLS